MKINQNELRIGNILIYSENTGIWTVSGIHEYGIDCFDANEETYMEYENFESIPLAEEWLLRFGFEVVYRSKFTLRLDHSENFKFGAGWNLVNGHFHVRYIGESFTHIKYVHQLQNLYFALTGEELVLSN